MTRVTGWRQVAADGRSQAGPCPAFDRKDRRWPLPDHLVDLDTVLDQVARERLRPVIDRAFPLSEARAAVQHLLERRNRGKCC